METMTRKKGKVTHNVAVSENIPIKLTAARRSIEFMCWSVENIARYFIMILMPAGPMFSCVPDSLPWFFKITMVTPF